MPTIPFPLELLAPFLAGFVGAALLLMAARKFRGEDSGGLILWLACLVFFWAAPESWRWGAFCGVGAAILCFASAIWPLVLSTLTYMGLSAIRAGRGLEFPTEILSGIFAGGALTAFLISKSREDESLWWPLAGVLGGAMLAQLAAQGLGVACFALGLTLAKSAITFLGEEEQGGALESGTMLACGFAAFLLWTAKLPLGERAQFDGFLALWGGVAGALLASGAGQFSRFGNAVLALGGPIALGAIWGERIGTGLFLGAILGGAFGSSQSSAPASLGLLALLGLWPLAIETVSLARVERIGALVAFALLFVVGEFLARKKEQK